MSAFVSNAQERLQFKRQLNDMAKQLLPTIDFCGSLLDASTEILRERGFRADEDQVSTLMIKANIMWGESAD